MSREIDERVVQMSLENRQFERAAKQSLETVEKIKKDTDLSGAARAIRNSGMVEAVQHVSNAFTSFGGILKRKVFDQLADQVINTAKRMFREIEIDPITQGFSEYELKMGSVQTIMASTGASLKEVNDYLDELNTYADRTIYSFSDMTNNIGKFTNAGVKLEDAVAAIQGISNEAALSGANANEASRAMYNFAQALSSGVVRLIDWKSIENANMATVEFKNELIKTAEELGTVKKQADGTYKSLVKKSKTNFNATKGFNDALQDQWLTSEVLIKTLSKYSDETTDLGKRAYAAAQDVKTFTQLMDTLKEASGSGWAETWQIIFGNFDEAKELWTGVNNVIGKMIDNQSKSRNSMLQQWKDLGGRTLAIQALADAFEVLRGFVSAATEGFREFFPALTGQKLFDWTQKFRVFIGDIRAALPFVYESGETITGTGDQVYKTNRKYFKFEGVMLSVYKIFNGLGAAASIAGKAIGTIGSLLMDLVRFSLPGGEGVLAWLGTVGDRIAALRDELEENDFFGRWRKKVEDAVGPVGVKVTALGGRFREFFGTIATWFEESGIKDKVINGIQTFADDFIAAMPGVISTITDFINEVLDFLQTNETVQKILGKVQEFTGSLSEKIPTLYSDVVDFVKGLLGFGDESETLSARFNSLTQSIRDFVHELLDYDENGASVIDRFINKMFPKLTEEGEKATEESVNPLTKFVELVRGKVDDVKTTFTDLGTNISDGISWLATKWGELDINSLIGKAFAFWAGGNFISLIGSFAKLNRSLAGGLGGFGDIFKAVVKSIKSTTKEANGVFGSLSTVLKKFGKNMTKMNKDWTDLFRKKDTIGDTLLKIAGAIGILVAAVYVLSKFDDETFNSGATKLGILAAGLVIFTGIFNKMSKGIDIKDLGSQIRKMAFGIILLVGAIWLLSHMDTNGLLQGVFFLGIILTELAGFLQLSKGGGFGKDSSPKFISLAISLVLLVYTLKQLAGMSIESLAKSIIALGFILLELGGFTKLAGLDQGKKMASFFGLAFTLLSIVHVLEELAKFDFTELFKSITALGLIFLELGVFSRLAGSDFKFSNGMGFLMFALSLVAVVGVMKQIAQMNAIDLGKGLGVVTVLMGLMTYVSKNMGSGIKISSSIGLLIAMVGSIAAFFEVLYLLKDYPPRQMLSIAGSFALVMGGVGIVIGVLSKIPIAGLGTALANMGIIVGLIGIIGGALAAIDHYFDNAASKALKSMAGPLQTLGEALGSFFGGIIGGAGDAIMSKLPAMGKYLGDFMKNAGAFFEGVKKIDGQTFLGGEALALILGSISGAEILEGIARFFNFGQSSVGTFSDDVVVLGEAIGKFAGAIDGVDTNSVTEAANAAGVLATLNNTLPAKDGILQDWFGEKSLSGFAADLVLLGGGLALFAFLTSGIDNDRLTTTANAVKVLGDLAAIVPPTGGLFQWITGTQDVGAFGNKLGKLGSGIKSFADKFKWIKPENLDLALKATEVLGKFAVSVPKSSLFDWFTGGNIGLFSDLLPGLGTNIHDFVENFSVGSITTTQISNAGDAATMISTFASNLTGTTEGVTAFIRLLRAADSLGTFATNLGTFGENLKSFKTNTSGIRDNTFDGAIGAAKAIASFAEIDLKNRSLAQILGQFLTKETDIQAFGNSLGDLGTGLASFNTATQDIKDWSALSDTISKLQDLADLAEQLGNLSWMNFTFNLGEFAGINSDDWTTVLSGINGLSETLTTTGNNLAQYIIDGANETLTELPVIFSNAGLNAGTELINSLSRIGYAVYQMGITIGGNLRSGLRYIDYYSVGQDAAQGFINGIRDSRDSAYRAGVNLGASALQGTKTKIDSASPSKEFMKLGSYSGEGFAIGLDDWAKRAETSGSNIANSALLGAKTALGYLYSILNDSVDLQPVIRPVVDTSGIAMGSAQIGNMLANSAYPVRGFAAPMTPQVSYLGGFENIEALSRSNQNVVNAVNALGNRIDDLGSRIANLKMVTDTGKLAGEMREQIDTNLGVINFRKGRRN